MRAPREATPAEVETYRQWLASPEFKKGFENSSLTHYGFKPVKEQETISKLEGRPIERSDWLCLDKAALSSIPTKWFSLAALYFVCKINFDLIEEFKKSELFAGDIDVRTFVLPFKLFPDIPGWDNVIQACSPLCWNAFLRFLRECGFQRTLSNGRSDLFFVKGTLINVRDKTAPGSYEVAVFTPKCSSFEVSANLQADGTIRFFQQKPSQETDIAALAKKVFGKDIGAKP